MEKYSCWYWPYCARYYLTHPWKWFGSLWRNIKDVCMRARYGFTWGDVWDWDQWFLHTTPKMFRHMASHGSAYPGYPPFDAPEKWHDWLNEMADLLESGNEEWQDEHNEYFDEYMKHIMDNTESREDIRDRYLERAEELAKQGEENVRRALLLISEHFFAIWD